VKPEVILDQIQTELGISTGSIPAILSRASEEFTSDDGMEVKETYNRLQSLKDRAKFIAAVLFGDSV
jgi:hypothetical protein